MIIYKVTNLINGKIYIGKTKKSLQSRWNRHINDALTNRLDTHFARAIRKYDPENFTIEQIDSATSEEELDIKEKYWIRYYKSCQFGYNATEGGDGGNTYITKNDDEMDEIRQKIRATKIGKLNPNSRAVKMRNEVTKEELHFGSAAEARDYFGETNHNFVTRRCKRKTNYLFRGEWNIAYEEDEYNPNFQNEKSIRTRTHNHVLDLETGKQMEFNSYAAAEKHLGLKPKTLSSKAYLKGDTFIVQNRYKITVLN